MRQIAREKNSITGLFLLCAFILLVGGCRSGPQYISTDPDEHPANMVSIFIVDLRLQYLKIDNTVVKIKETLLPPEPFFLSPGRHTLKYRVYGTTDRWLTFSRMMRDEGYTLSEDANTYTKEVGGVKISKNVARVSRYGWNKRQKEIVIEAGKRYKLSDFYIAQ